MSAGADATAAWEVYVAKYAEADGLPPATIEVGANPQRSTYDMAYYVWLI